MTKHQGPPRLVLLYGGYRELQSYQMPEIVYDATAVFCDWVISKRPRTHDQMVQTVWKGWRCHVAEEGRRRTGLGKYLLLNGRRGDGKKHSCFQRQGNQEDDSQQ
jgi:hypothetical protein